MQTPALNKILYVEDELDIQIIVTTVLEDLGGFNLKVCSCGQELLNVAPEFEPDLFLLDVMLPDMDGPTILQELRKIDKFSKTPVIFITAKVQMHEIVKYNDMGILGIIKKPFDPITISDFITKLWNDHYEGVEYSNKVQ